MNPLWAAHDRRVARHTWVMRITGVAFWLVVLTGVAIVFSIPEPGL